MANRKATSACDCYESQTRIEAESHRKPTPEAKNVVAIIEADRYRLNGILQFFIFEKMINRSSKSLKHQCYRYNEGNIYF